MKKLLYLILLITSVSFSQTANYYYNKGLDKFESKDYKGAISEFTKSININPNDAETYNNRGVTKNILTKFILIKVLLFSFNFYPLAI